MNKNGGYTLIELLVVAGILVAVSAIIGGILTSTLRTTELTTSKTLLAQNGNYAMSTMSELIKRSEGITAIGEYTDISNCSDVVLQGSSVTLRMSGGASVMLSCTADNRVASTSGATTYHLTNEKLAVAPDSCNFTCTQSSPFTAPRIGITYELGKRNTATGEPFADSTETFQTEINVRNFNN